MKIKEGFVLRNVGGSYLVVATGKVGATFKKIVELNETSAFLFNSILNGASTLDDLVNKMTLEYDVDKHQVEVDIKAFIEKMKGLDIIE